MSTIKSSAENLTLNADGANNDIIFQSNGSNVATLDQAGLLTATTFAGSGASLTALNATNLASGTVPTARLGTGTANSTVHLRGDGAWAAAGGGKLLQTVKFVEDSTEQALATTTYTDTNLSVSITPTSTTSKILCMWNVHAYLQLSNRGVGTRLLRDTTDVFTTTLNYDMYVGTATDTFQRGSYMHLDSPSTTSSITYKVQVSSYTGNAIELNGANSKTQLMLMEIGA